MSSKAVSKSPACERKEQAEKQLAEATRGWVLRGRLFTTKLQFAEVEKAYGEAVKASPGDFDACFQQAYLWDVLKRYNPAVQGYVRCLGLARSKADPASVAMTLNNLGLLHCDQNRMEEARKAYEEALGIRRQLALSNPDTYLPDLARVLWSIGRMHIALKQDSEARQALKEALGIFQNFAAKDRARYQRFVDAVNADLSKVTQ